MSTTESWDQDLASYSGYADPTGGQGGDQEHWSGRMPPQDLEAEQSVLGSMLMSKDAIGDVNEVINGADFYKPAHEMVYDAIVDLYGKGEPADPITVKAELEKRGQLERVGGAPYLFTLHSGVPIAANASFYASIVREKAILRKLVDAGTRIAQMGYAGEGDVDNVVDVAQQEVYAIGEKRATEDYLPLSAIMEPTLDEIEAISNHDGSVNGVPTGFADLDDLINGFQPGQMVIVAARPAMGKALSLDTPLPTPRGWTTMGEVVVGDELLSASGRPTKVVAATEVMLGRPCYEVTFSDGSVIVADAQHQWVTDTRRSRQGHAPEQQVVTTEQIAATLRVGADQRANHSVRLPQPLEGEPVDLPVGPYTLGAWLGDGHSASARITSETPEIPMRIEAEGYTVHHRGDMLYAIALPETTPLPPRYCEVCGALFAPRNRHVRTCGQSCGGRATARPLAGCPDCGAAYTGGVRCQACHRSHGSVAALLRSIGVLGDKHIPVDYLRAPEPQRRALLAGLLDTDGYVTNANGTVQISLTNARLADGVYELITSLGYLCSRRTRRVRGRSESSSTAHLLSFSTQEQVFWLERKALVHKERTTSSLHRSRQRYIVDVRPIDSVPVRCVEVDNAEHLYLAGRGMIPTHNSTLGLDFCRAASIHNNMTSVIFSLEMSKSEITMRLLSAEAAVPLNHLRKGPMSDDDWAKLGPKMGEVSSAPMFIDDSPNMTMMEIRAKARRLKQRHGLRLIVIDYLQLMTSGKKVESRQVEVSEFSRQIKLLAKELEVPIIALSQLNRGPEQRSDKRPMMSDLRESGSIEQDADIVMLLHREDAYERESPRAGEADIIVAKHRNGPTRDVVVAFQGHLSRFADVAHY